MREEQSASVWPRLVIGSGYTPGQNVEFGVRNAGIGPAVIKSVTASVDGHPVAHWGDAFEAMIGERSWSGSMTSVSRGLIVPAGEKVTAFQLRNGAFVDRLVKQLDRLRFDVCYCSVYDRCWRTSSQGSEIDPTPVRTCTAARVEFR